MSNDRLPEAREEMVVTQIQARGIRDPRVLAAMRKVPRHLFVPEGLTNQAYDDHPLPIGFHQTISQPYIVGLMTELAGLDDTDIVLEIGTGSGYQAAILAECVEKVYSIEIIQGLAVEAKDRLEKMGYNNISVRCGDGYKGWPEAGPFDAIIVTAAPPEIPVELTRQLKPGGRLVIPVGEFSQELMVIIKNNDGSLTEKHSIPVRFVPMVHKVEE